MWTHLERQRGGIGLRGPGETEIETDRRIVRDRISLLKEKLSSIDKQMATQRKNRGKTVRGCPGRIYQRGQIDTYESVEQIGRLCREQTVRHTRYHSTKGGDSQPSRPSHGYGRFHTQTAYTAHRIVQIDA